jgi:hypothetical protein
MKTLKFQGDITLDEVFNHHKKVIYDNLIASVERSHEDLQKTEATIIKISINDDIYTINLSQEKFVSGLEKAITFYEELEEYEKCAKCLKMINSINSKKMEVD